MTAAIASADLQVVPSSADDLTRVVDVVRRRHRAAARGDAAALEDLLHPVWCAKRATAGDGFEVESRTDFLARSAGAVRQAASAPDITSLQMCFGDFAVVRADAWSPASTFIHLLFAERGVWRIAGEAAVALADGRRDPQFTPRAAEAAVLDVLAGYYRGVTTGDAAILGGIFSPAWQMKNHQDGRVVAEDKPTFLARITRPYDGYWSDRQIADVQIVADRLALVRVDKPSVLKSTMFLFVKSAGVWSIIDKAFSGAPSAG